MKKTLKVLGLLLVAATMFTGCKKDADDGEKNIQEALFDKAEATKNADKVNYTDGSWTLRFISTTENPYVTKFIVARELNYKFNGNTLDETAFSYVESGIVVAKEDFSEEDKANAKNEGFTNFSGKEATYYRECNYEKYVELYEKFGDKDEDQIADEDKIDYMLYSNVNYGMMAAMMLGSGQNFDEFKSNDAGTKYYGKRSRSSGTTEEYYIVKN